MEDDKLRSGSVIDAGRQELTKSIPPGARLLLKVLVCEYLEDKARLKLKLSDDTLRQRTGLSQQELTAARHNLIYANLITWHPAKGTNGESTYAFDEEAPGIMQPGIDIRQSPYSRILYNGLLYTDEMEDNGKAFILRVGRVLLPIADELAPWEGAYIQLRDNGTFAIDDGFPPQLILQIVALIH